MRLVEHGGHLVDAKSGLGELGERGEHAAALRMSRRRQVERLPEQRGRAADVDAARALAGENEIPPRAVLLLAVATPAARASVSASR